MKGSLKLFLSKLSPQLAQVYGRGTTSDLGTERESHWQARPWGLKWRSSVAFVTFGTCNSNVHISAMHRYHR